LEAQVLRLYLRNVTEKWLRDNFDAIQSYVNGKKILQDWDFFDVTFSAAITAREIRHSLGSIPMDILQTYKVGSGNVTYLYESFTKDSLYITTDGPCRIRFFAGSYKESV
jgi:hypothetical protein